LFRASLSRLGVSLWTASHRAQSAICIAAMTTATLCLALAGSSKNCCCRELTPIVFRRDATKQEIRKKYRKLSLQWHPDKNPAPEAKVKFTALGIANGVLSKDASRESYDHYLDNPDDYWHNTAAYYTTTYSMPLYTHAHTIRLHAMHHYVSILIVGIHRNRIGRWWCLASLPS
jgi:hypothetical protein